MSKFNSEELDQLRSKKVFVAGHRGMVGSALVRRLQAEGCENLLLRTHSELDLTDQSQVREWFAAERPDYVFLAAAKVGGIHANSTYPAQFIYDNLMIAANIIEASYQTDLTRLLFLGSSCIYPRLAPQPMNEEALLTSPLEPTNEPYAVAKIAGIKLCESFNREYDTDYRSAMPTNLYGPEDNFELENSHVLPALIRKFHDAKQGGLSTVELWGSGTPRRDFLHVDDLAEASLFVMCLPKEQYSAATQPMLSHLNVGSGIDVTIRELAETIREVTGFRGKLVFDTDRPDGTPNKLMDVSKLASLGWSASKSLREGIAETYQWYLDAENRSL